MKMKTTLLAAAALSLLSTAASAVDWGGYLRVGPGQKQSFKCADGGSDGGHGGIGRLGNECNTYGEFALSQGGEAGGVTYKTTLMANFYQPGSDPGGKSTDVNQIYVEGKGFDVAPNQTFWVGRRFYHRADVHFDDTFFVNMTGSGAGVDGFDLGGAGTLSVAVFRTSDSGTNANPGSRLNLDLEGVNVNPGGKLRVTGVFTKFSGPNGKSGAGISVQHNQSNVFGGDNVFWAQYAQGSAYLDMGFGGANDDSNKKRWRLVESPSWTKGPLTGQGLFEYGEEKTGNDKRTYASAAGRVAYAFTKNFKLQGELGTSSFKWHSDALAGTTARQSITKLTIAPTLTVGQNYYDRPELRFYVSTFSMNDAYRVNHGFNKKTMTAAGIQAEIWF